MEGGSLLELALSYSDLRPFVVWDGVTSRNYGGGGWGGVGGGVEVERGVRVLSLLLLLLLLLPPTRTAVT